MSVANNLFQKADHAYNKEQYDYARELLTQALNLDPDNVEGRKLLYKANIKLVGAGGKKSSKLTLSLKGTKLLGELALTRNPLKKIELSQQHLNTDPYNNKVRLILAKALVENGHIDGGLTEAQIVVERDRKNHEAYKIIGTAYIKKNMINEAQQAFDIVKQLVPTDRDVDKLIRDLAATTTMRQGFDTATSYRDVIKDKRKAEELEKSEHLIKTKDDVFEVIEKLKVELDKDPDNIKLIRKIGDHYLNYLKDYKSASGWYTKALKIAPEESTIKDKIDDCRIKELQKIIEAQKSPDDKKKAIIEKLKFEIKSFERRVKERPTDSLAHYELGKRYFMGKLLDRAIAEFQYSVKDPRFKTRSMLYLGISFQKRNMYDIAHEQYENAEKSTTNQDELLEIWYNRAVCFAEEKNLEKAIEMNKKIMQININYKDVANKISKWQKQLETRN